MASATYMEAMVLRSVIEASIPTGEDTKRTFEMRLYSETVVLANAASTLDPWDIRTPKAIRAVVIALRNLEVAYSVLFYEGIPLSRCDQKYKVKSGDSVIVDWCVINGDQSPNASGLS